MSASPDGKSPSQLIDERIRELGDWRGETLARLRALIREADPEVVEEWKWRGVPVWSHAGIICTGETYKKVVKMTFLKGAALDDPAGLFNASLEGNTRRAIDIRQGETIDEAALKSLVRAAVALNTSKARRGSTIGLEHGRIRRGHLLDVEVAKLRGFLPRNEARGPRYRHRLSSVPPWNGAPHGFIANRKASAAAAGPHEAPPRRCSVRRSRHGPHDRKRPARTRRRTAGRAPPDRARP